MHDEHPHPLLAQIPLTVSPFLALPTATPLPYTYKQLPSTLPPSILNPQNQNMSDPAQQQQQQQQQQQPPAPAYVVSATGTTATPDSILQSCLALQSHLAGLESSARETLKSWEDARKQSELAEKRRVAPGWLDADVKLLVPENVTSPAAAQGGADGGAGPMDVMDGGMPGQQGQGMGQRRSSVGIKGLMERRDGVPDPREGEELDRVFGGLDIK